MRLFVVMIEFKQYKKSNNITADQFKTSLKKVIAGERQKLTNKQLSENEKIRID